MKFFYSTLERFCGWLIWSGLKAKYVTPVNKWNRWLWVIGGENAIKRCRSRGCDQVEE